jgi:hypothetical protein
MGDGGMVGPACTNCHGLAAMSGPFRDIAHTPEQTGGFSDQDLIDIVVNGVVPDGGYFDNAILPYDRWQRIHKWDDITDDQKFGMVVYLRSLTPTSQTGTANFGGRMRRDGGMGGMGPPPDSGSSAPDAGGSD